MVGRMTVVLFVGIVWLAALREVEAGDAVEVRVRQTSGGPRIFVDGAAVRPRFFYGSPPCLSPISTVEKHEIVVPFRADADTGRGCVRFDGFDGDEPMWFSNPVLVDVSTGETNVLRYVGEERTRHFVRDRLIFKKGHLYRFHVTHRAVRFRTYFRHEVSYVAADGSAYCRCHTATPSATRRGWPPRRRWTS